MKFMRGLDDPGDELGPVAGLVELVVLDLEASIASSWRPKSLTMAWPRVHLLDVAVERAGRGPLGDELLLRTTGDQDRHRRATMGTAEQRDHREERADREHHDQHADDRQQRRDELGQALLERLADVVDVVGDAAQQVAAGMVVEVAQRQPGELVVDVAAQPVDGPLGDPGHDVRLSPTRRSS